MPATRVAGRMCFNYRYVSCQSDSRLTSPTLTARLLAWCRDSGLSPATQRIATDTIQRVLPYVTMVTGFAAACGAAVHLLFMEPGFRTWALPAHIVFTLLGAFWWKRRPRHPYAATLLVGTYLTSVIGSYVISGEFGSMLHLGIVAIGTMYLCLDRRLLLAQMSIWSAWVSAIAIVWLPDPRCIEFLVVSLISLVGAAMLHRMRKTSIEQVMTLQAQLARSMNEREAAMQKAQQAEKLESLVAMAAGIAHDYNNLLVGVVGGLDLAEAAQTSAERKQALDSIRHSNSALRSLSAKLMDLSGGAPVRWEPVEIGRVVTETVAAIRHKVGNGRRIQLALDPDVPTIAAESASLRQIVLNLLTNALEALPADTGHIRVGVTRPVSPHGTPADHVLLWVEDDGPGIPDALRSRIFDPFFTTREPGRGLGLAIVAAIARRLNGTLQLTDSTQGARFEVRLPIEVNG
ncbi:MAG: HAMP domain-containing histidine kinase [Pseudomonadales bacterium]|nr:HAMP domain-containing histidine kinase [Pseudomonadales bacterium]MCP5185998.1 HAMP domain-containing histidine kinase [Pseudomonadales bacterium]